MKIIKKIFTVLCLILVLNFITPFKYYDTAKAETVTLESLQKKYPNGMVWNDSYYFARQCAGFARLLFYEYYGYNPVLYAEETTDLSLLKAGDVLRYEGDGSYAGGHEVFVIGVNGNQITVAECNWHGPNVVNWGRVIYKSNLANAKIQHIYRAPYELGATPTKVKAASNIKIAINSSRNAYRITWDKMENVSGYVLEIYKASDVLKNDFTNPVKKINLSKATSNSQNIDKIDVGDYYVYVKGQRGSTISERGNGVKFKANPITSITLDKTYVSTIKNQKIKLTATINPSDTDFNKTITWTSSNETVASVDSSGNVTTYDTLGSATIYAEASNGVKVYCIISVNYTEVPIQSIFYDRYFVTLMQNEQTTIKASYFPENATGDKTLKWYSLDDKIATVDQNGTITGVSEGEVAVYAESVNGMRTAIDVTVTKDVAYPLTGLSLSESKVELIKGEERAVEATIYPSNTTDSTTVFWSSSDMKVASVTKGKITAKGIGHATITAYTLKNGKHNVENTLEVVVNPIPIDYATVSRVLDREYTGDFITPKPTVQINNKILHENEDFVFIYSNNKEVGTATITIKGINDYTGYQNLTFNIYPKPLELNTTTLHLKKGQTAKLEATLANVSNPHFTWTSKDNSVASVDSTGLVTANQNGVTTITVSYGDEVATCLVIVQDYLKGDLNFNGEVTVSDAVEALYYFVGSKDTTSDILSVGDFNNDNKISVVDAIEILRIFVS